MFSCIFSRARIACLSVTMHPTRQQYSWKRLSREPTHWMNAIVLGVFPSLGLWIFPPVGPEASDILSNSMLVMTFLKRPYPNSAIRVASKTSDPTATIIPPTLMLTVSDFCLKSTALASQAAWHLPQMSLSSFSLKQFSGLITAIFGTACEEQM